MGALNKGGNSLGALIKGGDRLGALNKGEDRLGALNKGGDRLSALTVRAAQGVLTGRSPTLFRVAQALQPGRP